MFMRCLFVCCWCLYLEGLAYSQALNQQHTTDDVYQDGLDIATMQCITHNRSKDALSWRKYLERNLSDHTQVSRASDVLEPFYDTGRYGVTYRAGADRIMSTLTIAELRVEDSGVYECATNSGETKQRLQLHVLVPVKYVELLGALNSGDTIGRFSSRGQLSNDSDPYQLSYDVRQAGILECIAYGGNPAPHARIFVADEELVAETSNVRHSLTFSLEGTTRGLQWYNFTARHYSDDFRLAPSAEGKRMRCVGDVAEKSDPKQTSVVLIVLGEPSIQEETCHNQTAIAEENRVNISCEFRCNPACHRLIWNATDTGDIISMIDLRNDTINPHVTVDNKIYVEKLSDVLYVTHIEVDVADEVGSQFYVLTVFNEIGLTSQTIRLDIVRLLTQVPPIEKDVNMTIAIVLGSLLVFGLLAGSIHMSIIYYKHQKQEDTQTDEIELDNDDIPTDTPEGHRLSTVYERRHSVFSGSSADMDDPTNHGDHRQSSLPRPKLGGDNKLSIMSRIIQEESETMHAHQQDEDSDDFAPRRQSIDGRRQTGFVGGHQRRQTSGYTNSGRRRTTGFNPSRMRRQSAAYGQNDTLTALEESHQSRTDMSLMAKESALNLAHDNGRPTGNAAHESRNSTFVGLPEVHHHGARNSVAVGDRGGPRRVRRTTVLL